MKITDSLDRSCIQVPLRGTDKTAVITELVDLLFQNKRLTSRDAVLGAVLARERVRSTGVGEGLAVPHAKCEGVPRLTMAVGKPAEPLDFESADRRPCQMIVLLIGPRDAVGPHLQALAGISRLWLNPSFRESVAQAATPEELYAAFERLQT